MTADAHLADSAPPGRLASLGVLFAATVVIAIAGVHFHVVGALVKPYGEAYGWSRGEVAFALTISSAVHPFTNVAIGWLVDRYNARVIALPGIVGFSMGLGLLAFAGPALWTWYAGYMLFSLLGAGASSVIWTKLIIQHFSRRRGLALATSLAGAGILVSTVPGIVYAFEDMFGLRGVYPALAVCAFALMFVPAWLFLPRAASATAPGATRTIAATPASDDGGWRAVVKSGLLRRLALALLLIASCVGAFIVHLQPMLSDAGIPRDAAAQIALLIGPALVVGRLGTGMLFDVLPTRLVAAVAFTLPGFACLWLLAFPLTVTSASALAVLIGIGMGSEVDVCAYLTARYFGLRRYGLVFGILISIYGFAVGTSAWLVGKVYDAAGSYEPALIGLIGGVILGVVLIISLGRPPEAERR